MNPSTDRRPTGRRSRRRRAGGPSHSHLTAGTTRQSTYWIMPVTNDGAFSGTNPDGETAGRFYGPEHEEAGGTFTYDDLAGAYGLKRQ